MTYSFDILIIGSGAAGLMTALELDERFKVAVISKGELANGSTNMAQGGISAVLGADDSFAGHVNDTVTAGAGLCRRKVVEKVVSRGPVAIEKLINLGVDFTRNPDGSYHLTKEGGHDRRRVIHVDDATGAAVEKALISHAKSKNNITVFTHHLGIDLISERKLGGNRDKILGSYVLDIKHDQVLTFRANFVILATGGASKAYLYTSNPDGSTGDGIALAWRAGCAIANMEFNQFHPTCLYHQDAKSFLISEAVRGEGGKLILPDGTAFMEKYDSRGELAPRDIVARAIDNEMKTRGLDHVLLDISHLGGEFIQERFPVISGQVRKFGFDMVENPLPVVPAAHYTCGGVMVDINGKTAIDNLYAVGEVSATGMHGANRMASNSLLECLVYAMNAAANLNARDLDGDSRRVKIPKWDESRVVDSDEMVVVSHNWDELRRFMWDYVGIVRTDKRLFRARNRIRLLRQEINEYYSNFRVHNNLLELRNLAQVSELIIESALLRKESRGLHYNTDYPELLPDAHDTVLQPAGSGADL